MRNPLETLRDEPGWFGAFTRVQAEGALPSGARIMKCNTEQNDGTPDGTLGTVLGSVSHPKVHKGAIFYFIEWDNRPRVAVGVISFKVSRLL